ncbi:23571_t:CDS:10, partial [Dentiscutata erythropus]
MVFNSDIKTSQDGVFHYVTGSKIPDNKIIYLDGTTNKGYTFGQFKSESKKFAAGLQDKVGFKHGGKVTLVDPKYVASELSFQLVDSGASILIVHPNLLETAITASKEINIHNIKIFLFGDNEISGYKPFRSELIRKREIEPIYYTPEDANSTTAYICYSSGTTGKQKGVEITHTNFVANLAQLYSIEKDLGPHSILAGVLGATVVIFPNYNIETFCFYIEKYKIDYVYAAPPIILDLVNYSDAIEYLSSVKMIAYGLTEALIICYSDSNNIIAGSCGTPLPNIKVKILSADGNGPNKHGELCVHSPAVMKGYLKNSEATNTAFDNYGFLHTGDYARVDDQGNYYIVGRIKELIKYKRFSVAPAELESILLKHEKIFDAAVIGFYSEKDQTELPIAYIVLKSEENENNKSLKNEIIQYVNSKVAPHKKIRDLLFINKIPKNKSGKILRRELRELLLVNMSRIK